MWSVSVCIYYNIYTFTSYFKIWHTPKMLNMYCFNFLWILCWRYTGHTPKHSLTLTVFSFDRSKEKSSWHLKLTDKTKSVLFFCFGPKGSVCKVIPSLFLFCSVGKIRYVSFLCCCEVHIGSTVSRICDKLWTKVRSKHDLLTLKMCCIRLVAAQCLL